MKWSVDAFAGDTSLELTWRLPGFVLLRPAGSSRFGVAEAIELTRISPLEIWRKIKPATPLLFQLNPSSGFFRASSEYLQRERYGNIERAKTYQIVPIDATYIDDKFRAISNLGLFRTT
jgi:hypothetical protein